LVGAGLYSYSSLPIILYAARTTAQKNKDKMAIITYTIADTIPGI